MNADGSDLHRVKARGGVAAFTPDGQHLAYECCSGDGPDGIFLMRADGSDAPGQRLTRNPFKGEDDINPEVSPDGQTVTFVRQEVEGKLAALYAVDIDGSHVRRLTSYRLEVGIKHDWSPDGRRIVLTAYADHPDHKSPKRQKWPEVARRPPTMPGCRQPLAAARPSDSRSAALALKPRSAKCQGPTAARPEPQRRSRLGVNALARQSP